VRDEDLGEALHDPGPVGARHGDDQVLEHG
jgi:hypothetical protein